MNRRQYQIFRLNVVEAYLKHQGLKVDWTLSYYEQGWAFIEAMDSLARLFQIRSLGSKGWSKSRVLYYRCVRTFEMLPF